MSEPQEKIVLVAPSLELLPSYQKALEAGWVPGTVDNVAQDHLARIAADHGWYLSFAGTVTFKNAAGLREALSVTPLDRIMVETDAPYLTPSPFRGRPNSPYLIPLTLRAMAEHLDVDVDELAAQVASTTEHVYGSWAL